MKEFLARYVDAEAFDKVLSGYLRGVDIPDALKLPINNALLSVGKRLRPALCYLGSDLAGGDRRDADPFAAAIECIHCYSLVHDDLECMDNDAYRHGKPAIHAQFGEDIAVLCGDALLNLAFEILIGNAMTPERRRAAEIVARKAGVSGMIGGQAADVSGSARDLASLEEMYRKKTGALLAAALMSGAAVGGTDDLTLKRLEIYAYDIDTREPVCYDVYEGNLLDTKTYGDFIESNDLRDVLLVGDKVFTENAAKPQFSSDRNLGYMFPIRRNAAAIRRFDLRAYDGHLNSHPSVTYKVAHDVEAGVWYYSFRDSDRASQEEKAFLAQLRKSGKGLDPDKLASMKERWGTVIYKSNREVSPEQAYGIYLDRWMLEQMFDLYKNILELDETRVHSDLSDFGTSLVNFLSTLITSRIIRHLLEKGVLDDRSYDDARDILGKTLRFRNEDGTWTYRALAENDKVVLRQLDLIPKLPPKKGPGRPRKSV